MTDTPRRPTIVPMGDPGVAETAARADVEPLQTRVGRHWAQENDDTFCYDHELERWMRWTGYVWEEERTDASLDSMINFVEALRMRDPRGYKSAANMGFLRSSLSIAAASRLMARKLDDFDADGYLLNTPSGYVDLTTGALYAPDQRKLMTRTTAVSAAETEDCPRWKAFLAEAHAGQEDVLDWLQKVAGLCCIGDQRGAQFAYFYGTGGNGKSVFTGVLQRILKDYATQAQAGTFTMPEGYAGYSGHAQVLAVLHNLRMVVAAEPNKGEQWNMTRVKEWTGGNPIRANLMHKNGFPFLPVGFLIMEANEKLAVATVDDSVARRLRFLVWPHKFAGRGMEKKEIENFNDIMVDEEGPGILRWMINGALKVIEERLGSCETVDRYSDEYLQEQDTTRRFIDLCLEKVEAVTPGVDMRDAVSVYNEWALVNEVPSRKRIGDVLKSKGLIISRSNTAAFIRGHTLSETGMKFMTNVLSRKVKERTMTRADAVRWQDTLKGWKMMGEDGEYLEGFLSASEG